MAHLYSAVRRLFDWVAIRLSDSVRIDGLWVGVFTEKDHVELLSKLRDALLLIRTYDPYRYKRVLKEMDRLWVTLLPGDQAVWRHAERCCVIDPRHVRSASTELIAATIVHEATHGTLIRRGVGYPEDLRDRVEQVCRRQELVFASKVPKAKSCGNSSASTPDINPIFGPTSLSRNVAKQAKSRWQFTPRSPRGCLSSR